MCGDGPERERLAAEAARLGVADRVRFPGFVANPFPVFAAADAFVLSSRWEGLPTVLLEVMALETPVVSTDCPSGPAEILEGGRLGALVPVGDPRALAAALRTTLDAGGPVADRDAVRARVAPEAVAARFRALW